MSHLEDVLRTMLHAPVRNYVLPGLTSWLVGGDERHGRVRIFVSERDTREWIVPHSHRFDFACLVLSGEVVNTVFEVCTVPVPKVPVPDARLHKYAIGIVRQVSGGLGGYRVARTAETGIYRELRTTYKAGQEYAMLAEDIHSISFSSGARVLFFEGPERRDETVILEPWCDGRVVPTFTTAPWMFERDGAS